MSPVILQPSQELRRNGRAAHRLFLNRLPIQGPKFLTLPHSRTVKEGSEVSFECTVASNGAKTTWDKDRSPLSNKTNLRISTKEENELRVLEIRDVKQEDAGVYRIVLENQDGRIDASVRLDVVVRSRGSEQMKWCCSTSATLVSNDQGVRNGRGPVVSPSTSAVRNGNCFIQNNNKTEPESGKVTATMQKFRGAPVFRQGLQNIECADGDRVEFVVQIEGAQDVVWTRQNGQVIPNSPYFEHVHDQAKGLYKLVIHDAFPQDSGRYICKALSSGVSSYSVADLTVSETSRTNNRAGVPIRIKKGKMAEAKSTATKEATNGKVKANGENTPEPVLSDSNSNILNSENPSSVARITETIDCPESSDFRFVVVETEKIEEEPLAKSKVDATSSSNHDFNHVNSIESLDSLEEGVEPSSPEVLVATDETSTNLTKVAVPTSELVNETSTEAQNGDLPSPAIEDLEQQFAEIVETKTLPVEKELKVNDEVELEQEFPEIETSKALIDENDEVKLEEEFPGIETSKALIDELGPKGTSAIVIPGSDPQVTAEDFKEPQSPSSRSEDGTLGKPPSVFGPCYLIAMKEETVHIRIKYAGVPQPKVEWTINGKRCEDVVENTELTSVRIARVSYDDSGRYVAKVSNDHGTVLHHCFLSVEGPPEPPSTPPLAVYNSATNSISISWSGSPYDGGSMLTAYIIQTSIDEQEWSELCIGTWLTYSLQSPNPGSSYRFRIQCQNMYGPGTPSPVSPPVYIPGIQEAISNDEEAKMLEQLDVRIRPGCLQDNYTKGEELGKGRFGVVFAATKKDTGEVFAGKIIRCIKAADKVKVRQEVEIMNILRHPKLLQIMDAYENEREICIITEKINGGELFERVVADDFTLTEFDCVGFMRQICDGVRFMHQKNIIHLDLKPENILCLTRSTYNIKIIDFGLSQQYDSTTPLRVLFGTPEFISPEIINYEPISPASDMWALGVITYVLISGLSPFMGDSDSETFSNITQGLYDFEDEAFDHISDDAKDFISNLLIRRKEKRLTAVECLSHKWLAYPEPKKNIVIPTDKLKRFIIRRKWQKTGNAIRALGRMTNLYSSRRSSEAAASANRKSTDSGIDENARTKAESLSVEEEPEPEAEAVENEAIPIVEKKRPLIRQNRVDSDSV